MKIALSVSILHIAMVLLVPSTFGSEYRLCTMPPGTSFPNPPSECRTNRGRLAWQTDGNLVIYGTNGGAVWSTGTNGRGKRGVFQDDGNLVIYDGNNSPVWASNTDGGKGKMAVFQGDRNFVIYDQAFRPAWASHTQG